MTQLRGGKIQFPAPQLSPRVWIAIILLVVVAVSIGLVFTFCKTPELELEHFQALVSPPADEILKRRRTCDVPGYTIATRSDFEKMPTYICNTLSAGETRLQNGVINKQNDKCTVGELDPRKEKELDSLCIRPAAKQAFTQMQNKNAVLNDYDYVNIPHNECESYCQRHPNCVAGYVTDKTNVVNGVSRGCWIKAEPFAEGSLRDNNTRDFYMKMAAGKCEEVPAFSKCKNTGKPQLQITNAQNTESLGLDATSAFLRTENTIKPFKDGALLERAQHTLGKAPSPIECANYANPVGGCVLGSPVTVNDTFVRVDPNTSKCPWIFHEKFPQYVQCSDRDNWRAENVGYSVTPKGLRPLKSLDEIPSNQRAFIQKVECNAFKNKNKNFPDQAVGPCEIEVIREPAPKQVPTPPPPPIKPPRITPDTKDMMAANKQKQKKK